jgi:hypothetical protein
MSYPKKPLGNRFWSKVTLTARARECWLWLASTTNAGYGKIGIGHNKFVDAHRTAFELVKGNIPKNKIVLHTCDVRRCVNPGHLKLGTYKENTQDMFKKGRAKKYKLDADKVIKIRRLYNQGVSAEKLANVFEVHRSTIFKLLRNETWKALLFIGLILPGQSKADPFWDHAGTSYAIQMISYGIAAKVLNIGDGRGYKELRSGASQTLEDKGFQRIEATIFAASITFLATFAYSYVKAINMSNRDAAQKQLWSEVGYNSIGQAAAIGTTYVFSF